MAIPGNANLLLLTEAAGAAPTGYTIDRSVRFNSADSAYLSRTPASAGNRKTWTWAGWVKKAVTGSVVSLIGVGTDSVNLDAIDFQDECLRYTRSTGGSFLTLKTTSVYRDPSAWYHVVVAVDTTQATAADRVKFYINGTEQTAFSSSSYPSQNEDTFFNSTNTHTIGRRNNSQADYLDGYLADVHFIDGQALDPTDFGEFDDNGVWQPIAYTGSYGTNGFHLDFADNSSAAALGYDAAGSNDWTVNNIVANTNETAAQNFDVVTYTGNGGTQTIGGLQFQPDFVWVKQRNTDRDHCLVDSVRGATKRLRTNSTYFETTESVVTAFNSDGFDIGSDNGVNQSSGTYVAWCWKAGGAASSNTDGTITSSVSANQDYGFSISTFTSPSSGTTFTVGHGLNVTPSFVIVKGTGDVSQWITYHKDAITATNKYLAIESTAAIGTYSTIWGTTLPTSTVIGLTADGGAVAQAASVMYSWSEVAGFSKFGSYTGNGSTTGPVVTTGFKPRYLLVKRTDSTGSWIILDTKRDPNFDTSMYANSGSDSDYSPGQGWANSLDDGFQPQATYGEINASGGTYIYAAFAQPLDGGENDSLRDSPTNGDTANDTGAGGEVPGNYATLNPLAISPTYLTLANGNLQTLSTGGGATYQEVPLTIPVDFDGSSKWYVEFSPTAIVGTYYPSIGISPASKYFNKQDQQCGSGDGGTAYMANGQKYNAATLSSYAASFTGGDVIGVAVDEAAGTVTMYKNGSSQGTLASSLTGKQVITVTHAGASICHLNAGQRAFAYSAPSGFKALCTANLDDPTIADGSTAMDVALYTGNGSTQTISGLEFSPDFVWLKSRSNLVGNNLYDVIRGVNKPLITNSTAAEDSTNIYGAVSAFNSDGFDVQVGSTDAIRANASSYTYVAWSWDGGSSTVSNTDGSVTSSVRANASAGFSVVTYTGTSATAAATVGHGLGIAPEFIICKNRDDGSDPWWVYHVSTGNNKFLRLNDTTAAEPSYNAQPWNDTTPTSSVFSIKGQSPGRYTNNPNDDYVAYCFAPVKDYSAFGSYTGSADGPFVYTNFRPALVVCKCTTQAQPWQVYDSARGPYNVIDEGLQWNSSSAEYTGTDRIDFLSNGFKVRAPGGSEPNVSGQTYIYVAFAENPFKYARAR